MSELRFNPLTGRWVTMAAERRLRPGDFVPRRLPVQVDLAGPCPFCPGNEEETPPALESYGPHGRWRVRVVPNRYPAFAGRRPARGHRAGPAAPPVPGHRHPRGGGAQPRPRGLLGRPVRRPGRPAHGGRARPARGARLGAGRGVHPVHRQPRAGGRRLDRASPRPAPRRAVRARRAGGRAGRLTGPSRPARCCTAAISRGGATGPAGGGGRDRVVALCPYWSGHPTSYWSCPGSRSAHLDRAAPADLAAVGRLLRDVLVRPTPGAGRRRLQPRRPLAPRTATDRTFHWHVHVLPHVTTGAGFEQGTGVRINVVPPEAAARQLRDVARDSVSPGGCAPGPHRRPAPRRSPKKCERRPAHASLSRRMF